jgi:hypothetical protein
MLSVGFFTMNLAGCQTETPGATDTLGLYSTNIDSPCDKVTTAAKKAADDLKLTDVVAVGGDKENGKMVDGKVTARNAQGDAVTINIAVSGENVSKVTISVGATGDQALSKQLVDRIKNRLSWL